MEQQSTKPFKTGFPLGLSRFDNPMQIVEDTLFMRACQHGVIGFELYQTQLSTQQALQANALMPLLLDYANHVIGKSLQWKFETGMEDDVLMQILESDDVKQPIADLLATASDQVNRPALYNAGDSNGLLDARTQLRPNAGIPLSVTLLMLDMALETAHQMSQDYNLRQIGEENASVLDMTPVVMLLENMNAHPRVTVPENLGDRGLPTHTVSESFAASIVDESERPTAIQHKTAR